MYDRGVGNDDSAAVHGTTTPNTQYVLKDVPYSLPTTVLLRRLVGGPAILHESGMRILSAMKGHDFMSENKLLGSLRLLPAVSGEDNGGGGVVRKHSVPSLDRWREVASLGSFGPFPPRGN